MNTRLGIGTFITAVLLGGTTGAAAQDFEIEPVASGFVKPWSIALLPDGDILVTERPGDMKRVSAEGAISPVSGVPPVHYSSQGGLFDIVPHPEFSANQTVYLTYAHGDAGANATRVARATYSEGALSNLEVIYTYAPTKNTPVHFGGQLTFLSDGTFVLTTGDGFDYREEAQNLLSPLGKTMRLNADGTAPEDNPFYGRSDALPEIYTYGHRNPQGLFFDAQTGQLFETEHGPQGGDELNLLVPGKNYGWPIATYGLDYSGARSPLIRSIRVPSSL